MSGLSRLPFLSRLSKSTGWRKLLPSLAIATAISGGIVALAVFVDSDDRPADEPQGNAAADVQGEPSNSGEGAAGGGPGVIWPPKRVTEGDWRPPQADVKILQDLPLPPAQHVGEVINGITIVDPSAPIEENGPVCPSRSADLPFPLEATYLPPNTFQVTESEVRVCPEDGRMTAAIVDYQIGGEGALANFRIVYSVSWPDVVYGNGDVAAVEINGLKGVAVAAQTQGELETGFARVTLKTADGILEVGGARIPLEELLKIAEGLRCSFCQPSR